MKFSRKYSIEELIALLPEVPKIIGNSKMILSGMNEIHLVEEGDISFVDNEKYYESTLSSRASAILIDKEVAEVEGKCILVVQNPLNCMNALTRHFCPFVPSSAAISPSAKIGEGTIIQPNVFVGNNVVIGKNCIIHANVSIYDNCIIGDNVIIQANSVIGGDACYFPRTASGLKKYESSGRTIIGNDVEIGALCAIDRGVSGDTIIGDSCKFDNFVQIGHDSIIGKNCLLGCHSAIAGITKLEDNVIVWANAMVNKNLVIEEGTTILAISGVSKSLKKGVYSGIPATDARTDWKEKAALRNLPKEMEKISEWGKIIEELREKIK